MVLIAALLDALIRAYRLSKKHTLDELAALSWQQSEEAIADAFCRHWYVHPGSACRRWRDRRHDRCRSIHRRIGYAEACRADRWRCVRLVSCRPSSRDECSLERALDIDARVGVVIENPAKGTAYHRSESYPAIRGSRRRIL
jgi:hypothetical protein